MKGGVITEGVSNGGVNNEGIDKRGVGNRGVIDRMCDQREGGVTACHCLPIPVAQPCHCLSLPVTACHCLSLLLTACHCLSLPGLLSPSDSEVDTIVKLIWPKA